MNNNLLEYIENQSPELLEQLARVSPEAIEVIENHINSILIELPSQELNIAIQTDKESLRNLLTNAILTGYLFRSVETRMQFSKALNPTE